MIDISQYFVFLIPIASWFLVQGTKIIIFSLKHGWNIIENARHLGYGHMPSAHTGFVVSLATSVGYYSGLSSGAFAVAVIFAIITIDDSVRLRMQLGHQGEYINMLISELKLQKDFPRLKERLGHRISEVVVGGIYGFLLTMGIIKFLEFYPLPVISF
jgi:hypothetical protein